MRVCGELCVTDETGTGGGVSMCAGFRGERVSWLETPDGFLQLKRALVLV